MPERLKGRRVLVVEDEYFIANDIANTLQALGAQVVGPVADQDSALRLIGEGRVDFAVLDIKLGGEMAFAAARRAIADGIPFIFATGYEPGALPMDLQSIPFWTKPFDVDALASALAALPQG